MITGNKKKFENLHKLIKLKYLELLIRLEFYDIMNLHTYISDEHFWIVILHEYIILWNIESITLMMSDGWNKSLFKFHSFQLRL